MLKGRSFHLGKIERFSFLLFFAFFPTIRCQTGGNYTLYTGRPFYSFDQLSYARFYGEDVIHGKLGMTFRTRGIYTAADSAFHDSPMLRVYEKKIGLIYVPLRTELGAVDGDLVEVTGVVVRSGIPLNGTKRTQQDVVLSPKAVRIVHRSNVLKRSAQREYENMKGSLEKCIKPGGSRLIWPKTPRWYVVWSKTDGYFIVSARATDLMYQAEIDFVFDGQSSRVKEVYAVEWFKGE